MVATKWLEKVIRFVRSLITKFSDFLLGIQINTSKVQKVLLYILIFLYNNFVSQATSQTVFFTQARPLFSLVNIHRLYTPRVLEDENLVIALELVY